MLLRRTGLALAAPMVCGFEWPFRQKTEAAHLLIAGTSNLLPLFRELGAEFAASRHNLAVTTEGGGSGGGLIAVRRGAIDVAILSRDLTDDEDTPDTHCALFAIDATAVVVNPTLAVANLSRVQLRDVFEGRIENWGELGGPNKSIRVLNRHRATFARDGFQEMLLPQGDVATKARVVGKSDELVRIVAAEPEAIGYVAARQMQGLKALAIDGVALEPASVFLGTYPFTRHYFLVTHGEARPEARDFVAYVLSAGPQKRLAEHGLLPVR